jgi:hypothetical protein
MYWKSYIGRDTELQENGFYKKKKMKILLHEENE